MCVAPLVLSASGTSALFLSVSFVSSHFHPNQNPISHFILISPLPLPIIISPVCVSPCLLLSPSFSSWSLSTAISFLLRVTSLFFYPISTLFNPFSRFYSVFPRLSALLLIRSKHLYFKEIDKFIPPRIVETSFWGLSLRAKTLALVIGVCMPMYTGEGGGSGVKSKRTGKKKQAEMVLHLNRVWKVANLAKRTQEILWTK